jgi:hypothetical protein
VPTSVARPTPPALPPLPRSWKTHSGLGIRVFVGSPFAGCAFSVGSEQFLFGPSPKTTS